MPVKPGKTGKRIVSVKLNKAQTWALIAELDRKGWNKYEIGNHPQVKMDPQKVVLEIRAIKKHYVEEMIFERGEMVAEKIAQYKEIRMEAWKAWDKSNGGYVEDVEEEFGPDFMLNKPDKKPLKFGEKPDGTKKAKPEKGSVEESFIKLKKIVKLKGRVPQSHYLQIIMETLRAERDLLGLDTPKKAQLEVGDRFNWDLFSQEIESGIDVRDEVEERVLAEEAKLNVVDSNN